MISLSTMRCSPAAAELYLKQEHKALERYYNGPESEVERGVYVGGKALGLNGQVIGPEFQNILSGRGKNGEKLCRFEKENRRIGIDITFSPDKSISILWASLDESNRRILENTVFEATKDTIKHIEKYILDDCVRRGPQGVIREKPQELTFAVFQHGASRAGDPQLHQHAILMNFVQRQDGSWGGLEGRNLFECQAEIRRYHDFAMATRLKENHGIDVELKKEGIFIPQVPQELIQEYSKRRNEIWKVEDETETRSVSNRDTISIKTRQVKELTERELLPIWQEELKERGFSQSKAQEIFLSERSIPQRISEQEIVSGIEGVFKKFGETTLSLDHSDIRREIAQSFTGKIGLEDYEALYQRFLKDERLVAIEHDQKARFTTPEIIEQEKSILVHGGELISRNSHPIEESLIATVITRRMNEGMSLEQAQAAHKVLSKGDLGLIYGAAGVGKSYTLGAIREIAEEAGYSIRGLAPTGKASEELEKSSGIRSQTIHKYLYEFEKGKDSFHANEIIVVDEAGMLGSEKSRILLTHAMENGAKIILVGDDKQLSPIESGTPFSKLKNEFGASEILHIRRQQQEWQREAAEDIRDGNINKALCDYQEAGLIHHDTKWEASRARLVQDYLSEREEGKTQIILVSKNELRKEINEAIRKKRFSDREILKKDQVKLITKLEDGTQEIREFAKGDRLYFLKNREDLGVKNGTLGTIESIQRTRRGVFNFNVLLDNKQRVQFNSKNYSAIDHGYAATVHKSQGSTVDKSYIVVTKDMGKESGYVAFTRHREQAQIYCATELIYKANEEMIKENVSIYQKKLNLNVMTMSLEKEKTSKENIQEKKASLKNSGELSAQRSDDISFIQEISQQFSKQEKPSFKEERPILFEHVTERHLEISQKFTSASRTQITDMLYELASSPPALENPLQRYPIGQKAEYQKKAEELLRSKDFSSQSLQSLVHQIRSQKAGFEPVLTELERNQHLEKTAHIQKIYTEAKQYNVEFNSSCISPYQKTLFEKLALSTNEKEQIHLLKDICMSKTTLSPQFSLLKSDIHSKSFQLLSTTHDQNSFSERQKFAQNILQTHSLGKEGKLPTEEWRNDVLNTHRSQIKEIELKESREFSKSIEVSNSRSHGPSIGL